jgi:hypothetical protein
MKCKNCTKELPKDSKYIQYCDAFCYAKYNKKFNSLLYKKGIQEGRK